MAVFDEDQSLHVDAIAHVQRLSVKGWDRDLRGFLQHFQDVLTTEAMKEELERQDREQLDYLERSTRERSQDLEHRVFGRARERQQAANASRERQRQLAEEERAERDAVAAERWAAWEQGQADMSASRMADANAREAYARAAAARARAMELERKAEELRRQEMLAQRRAEALAAIADEQARRDDAKRRRDDEKQAQLLANEMRIEEDRQIREARFDDKIDRVNRLYTRKQEVMEEAQIVRDEVGATRFELKELLQQCARTRNYEPLKDRLSQLGIGPEAHLGGHASRPSSSASCRRGDGGGVVPSAPSTPRRSRPPSARRRQAATPRPRGVAYGSSGAWMASPVVPPRTMPPQRPDPMAAWGAAIATAAAAAASSHGACRHPRLTTPGWRAPVFAVKGGGSGSANFASTGSTTADGSALAASLPSPSSRTSGGSPVAATPMGTPMAGAELAGGVVPEMPREPVAREPIVAFDGPPSTAAAGTAVAAVRQRQDASGAGGLLSPHAGAWAASCTA
mmetsp:Transcript_34687/g.98734  ORF Transcript_34687/g.98734 Transcript_34687/m.98734 type:complete len:513 (+) Transcript_34687:229-1767(+)